ncbi:MAG: hypothetical protein K0R68_3782, partial [Mycobacterium sp.]|nr:hypothetical protein [Mycobacterium sp.]
MKLTRSTCAAAAVAGAVLSCVGGSVVAQADPLPYGDNTCIQGLVWREARGGDTVCVAPAVRDQVATQNANPASNKDPLAGSGPQSCSQGYVWREAFDGDTICVAPAFRQEMWAANSAAQANYQRNAPVPTPTAQAMVRFEVTGPGEVFNIVTDPPSSQVADHTKLPWVRVMPMAPNEDMLQVVATGRDAPGPGCRILVGDTVVAEQP